MKGFGGFHVKHQQMLEASARMLQLLGITCDPRTLDVAVHHLEWVLEQNKTINLTSITDPNEALRLHLIDSLAVLPYVTAAGAGPICDMGTGAGFPGVPLAVASMRQALLVDSVAKKVDSLQRFLTSANLDSQVQTSSERLESLAVSSPAQFSVVTARALTQLPSLVELAAPLLKDDGVLIAMKGPLQSAELQSGDQAAAIVGLIRTDFREYSLPEGGEARTLVIYSKNSEPRIRLPRRLGVAQKRPLA